MAKGKNKIIKKMKKKWKNRRENERVAAPGVATSGGKVAKGKTKLKKWENRRENERVAAACVALCGGEVALRKKVANGEQNGCAAMLGLLKTKP